MPVNSKHQAYTEMEVKWKRCRDVAKGGDAVKAAGTAHLPKLVAQSPDDYNSYKARAVFYNATWRTIAGLNGMLFRKPPMVTVPKAFEDWLENIDGAGKPLHVAAQEVSIDSLSVSRIGILVDHPPAPPGATKATAERLNLRPTMQLYKCESIINWKIGSVNNAGVPVQIVLAEMKDIPVDEFISKQEERWRVLDLVLSKTEGTDETTAVYRQRVFRKKAEVGADGQEYEQEGPDIIPLKRGQPLDNIPFVVIGNGKLSFDVEDPELIDLVDMNLAHYRNSAVYERCITFAPPTLLLTGFKKEKETDVVHVGSETAIIQSSPDADGRFIEYSGQGLPTIEAALDRKERHMAILGARMLEPQRNAVESADGQSIHRKGEESQLAAAAQAISLGITQALRWMVDWADMPTEEVKFDLNRDFFSAPMDPTLITALVAGWQAGVPGLSDQSVFRLLQDGEIVDQKVTLEEELARIAAQPPRLGTVPPEPDDGEGKPEPKPAEKKPAPAPAKKFTPMKSKRQMKREPA